MWTKGHAYLPMVEAFKKLEKQLSWKTFSSLVSNWPSEFLFPLIESHFFYLVVVRKHNPPK